MVAITCGADKIRGKNCPIGGVCPAHDRSATAMAQVIATAPSCGCAAKREMKKGREGWYLIGEEQRVAGRGGKRREVKGSEGWV